MNRMETLILLARGPDTWNDWADRMLSERQVLQDAGAWTECPEHRRNKATSQWHEMARADFSEHDFEAEDSFENFRFPGVALFEDATFRATPSFRGATFFDDAKFTGATLFQGTNFLGVEFKGDAHFSDAKFLERTFFSSSQFHGATQFNRARFEGETDFESSVFHGHVSFNRAEFFARTTFHCTRFSDHARFSNTSISDNVLFNEVKFFGDASFDRTVLDTPLYILRTRFQGRASFTALRGSSLVLHLVEFQQLPEFSGAHLQEPPEFDTVNLDTARLNRTEEIRPVVSRTARWRALRRLAVQGHDHERELQFFKDEITARRGTVDKWTGPRFWAGWLYEVLSDFGRSMILPLIWLLLSIWIFAGIYAGQSPHLQKPAVAEDLRCVSGSGNATVAALTLSVRNAVPFAGIGPSETLDRIYACLYGTGPSQVPTQGASPATMSPNIPYSVTFVGTAQFFLSAVLIFLLVLAIRNWFRIK